MFSQHKKKIIYPFGTCRPSSYILNVFVFILYDVRYYLSSTAAVFTLDPDSFCFIHYIDLVQQNQYLRNNRK